MSAMPVMLQFFMLTFPGWVNRRQPDVIDCLQAEPIASSSRRSRELWGGGLEGNADVTP